MSKFFTQKCCLWLLSDFVVCCDQAICMYICIYVRFFLRYFSKYLFRFSTEHTHAIYIYVHKYVLHTYVQMYIHNMLYAEMYNYFCKLVHLWNILNSFRVALNNWIEEQHNSYSYVQSYFRTVMRDTRAPHNTTTDWKCERASNWADT